ncbi:hypothetical protein CK203_041464 [Vitis vinifera]|uniref:Uncharacterized protein n=1 Tax=Vitis vinifera TaxID=29760 RepID=A0A438HNG6_VITVI|nr:hypothetical protein CK203_041464 [Vitis vinifera]
MSLRKRPSFAKSFRNSFDSSAKIFAAAKPSLAHECHFAEQEPHFEAANGCEATKRENTRFRSQSSIPQGISQLRNQVWHTSAISQHSDIHFEAAKISKGGNAIAAVCSSPSPSPTTREPPSSSPVITSAKSRHSDMARTEEPNLPLLPAANESARGTCSSPTSEPPRPEAVSPPAKPAPQNPPRGVISLEPSPAPSPVPSPAPPAQPQELQPPLSEPQIPSGVAPEVIIRRPMLTQPPIEGNLDCRARPFHSELCFDTATFQLSRSLRIHSAYCVDIIWSICCPRDFFYPRGASTRPHLLRGELPPSMFLIDAFLRHNIYPPALDSEERSSFGGPVQDF